jgi:hypothetical protein
VRHATNSAAHPEQKQRRENKRDRYSALCAFHEIMHSFS